MYFFTIKHVRTNSRPAVNIFHEFVVFPTGFCRLTDQFRSTGACRQIDFFGENR